MKRAGHGSPQTDGGDGTLGDPVRFVEVAFGECVFVSFVKLELIYHFLQIVHQRLHVGVDGLETAVSLFHSLHVISDGLQLPVVAVQFVFDRIGIGESAEKIAMSNN